MAVIQPTGDYFRFCPGEEQIKISNAICRGRRRSSFPKCNGCQFNDDQQGSRSSPAADEKARNFAAVQSVFRTYDIRAAYPSPLSTEVAWRIGHATAQFFHGKMRAVDRADPGARAIVTSRDARPHSEALQNALNQGLRAGGVDVLDIGIVDTPQIYFAVHHLHACGAVQATGGNGAPDDGGFAICSGKGVTVGADTGLASIADLAARVPKHSSGTEAKLTPVDLSSTYREFIADTLTRNGGLSRRLTMLCDLGGVADQWVTTLFGAIDRLTLNTMRVQSPDDSPKSPTAPLSELRRRVKDSGCDIGVHFDQDADTCVFADEKGSLVPADLIGGLLAQYFLQREPTGTIILDVRASQSVSEEIARCGGTAVRERTAPTYIKKAMTESGAIFGLDIEGRYYFRQNLGCESAFLAVAHVLAMLSQGGKRLSELVRPLNRYRSSGPLRFRPANHFDVIDRLHAEHSDAQIDAIDGLSIRHPDYWFHVRPADSSGILWVNLEAKSRKLVDQKLAELSESLGQML